ncbi:hypothetical protein IJJ97_03205, partial [bacterium]|nr:hypothetical protein [bacterium]
PENARKMIWSDTYMGAIRPDGVTGTRVYSQGTLNFHGMVISRFGDINADAGEPDGNYRKNQLGYVNQFVNFDTNLEDNSAPFFSISGQNFSNYDGFIKWNILSYIDMGSLNWQTN